MSFKECGYSRAPMPEIDPNLKDEFQLPEFSDHVGGYRESACLQASPIRSSFWSRLTKWIVG